MNNSNLEFRKIKSLNFLYEVNENGTIFRNVKSKRQLKIKLDYHHSKDGYYVTYVCLGGSVYKRILIHSIVAECWLGDRPDGAGVYHIDKDTHNNDYRNLRYIINDKQTKPIRLIRNEEDLYFKSQADCARFLSGKYSKKYDAMRDRLKKHRTHIFDYDVIYLNAETIHDDSTE